MRKKTTKRASAQKKRTAPMREKIFDNGILRMEKTRHSYLVHVKVKMDDPAEKIEDLLWTQAENAYDVIGYNRKNEEEDAKNV